MRNENEKSPDISVSVLIGSPAIETADASILPSKNGSRWPYWPLSTGVDDNDDDDDDDDGKGDNDDDDEDDDDDNDDIVVNDCCSALLVASTDKRHPDLLIFSIATLETPGLALRYFGGRA